MSDAEEEAWQQAIQGVTPLKCNRTVVGGKNKPRRPVEKIRIVPLKFYKHNLELGTVADIDRATIRRFKRQEFPVESVLDLHGFTEERAFEAVNDFVINAYLDGKRCVIIITGKGLNHETEDIFAAKGVLKQRVPQWLNGEELRQFILSYIHPAERLGGKGALYILLRRRRS